MDDLGGGFGLMLKVICWAAGVAVVLAIVAGIVIGKWLF